MWKPRYLHLEFDDDDNEQKVDTEPQPVRRRKNAQRRGNPFINVQIKVHVAASSDENSQNSAISLS